MEFNREQIIEEAVRWLQRQAVKNCILGEDYWKVSPLDFKEVQVIPSGTTMLHSSDWISPVTGFNSRYYADDTYLYRIADHWGFNLGNPKSPFSWTLDGKEFYKFAIGKVAWETINQQATKIK